MSDIPVVPPDLAALLATLAQHTPQTTHYQALVPTSFDSSPHPSPDASRDPRPRPQQRSNPLSRPATPAGRPLVDPASITEWREGLRCVTKIAAQNANFAASIRKMMDDQRKHELQWYAARQSLKQEQAKRQAEAAKAQNLLRSLSSTSGGVALMAKQTDEEKAAELTAFDTKLYKAQCDMNTAMTTDLKTLGVPFFGTKAELIVDGEVNTEANGRAVTVQDLIELQSRMIGHLEDMYRD